MRVYIDNGDRTDRKKARLKYVLDAWGIEKFLSEVETRLGKPLARFEDAQISEAKAQDRLAHVGTHQQKQSGKVWMGVVLPVGKMTTAQMRAIAGISRALGDGDIRLTVWQNLLISGIDQDNADEVETRLRNIGLTAKATSARAGLVACTGAPNCKFAAANTKGTAEAIATYVELRITLDSPINIHLTGCHHSCAQHYIGDIGMVACKVPVAGTEDTADGFHIHIGGGFGPDAAIARELLSNVKVEDCPPLVLRILKAYVANRKSSDEAFVTFARRNEIETLKALIESEDAVE